MSLDPAIFRALVANGATPEQLLAVVEAAAAVDEEKRAKKREGNARRQQEWRDRQRNADNALQSVTERDGVTNPSPDKSPPDPQKLTPTPRTHTRDARGPWPCPEGVDPRHWADFLANRKRKKLTNSQTAHEGVLADLANLADAEWPPGRLVQHAAAKGWGSINYPSDGPRNAPRNGTHGTAGNHGRSAQPAKVFAAGAGFLSGPAAGSAH